MMRNKRGTNKAQMNRKKTVYWDQEHTHTHLGPTEAETAAQDESETYLAYLVAGREWRPLKGKRKGFSPFARKGKGNGKYKGQTTVLNLKPTRS
eukprot:4600295-Amphidinium_carterae.2